MGGIGHEHGTPPEVAEPISIELLQGQIAKLAATTRGMLHSGDTPARPRTLS